MEEFGQVRLDWLKTFLVLRHGAPTHDTYNRVFQALDPEQFGDCLARWTHGARRVLGGEVVALDGKTLRRALKKGEDPRVIVNAWATESGLLLGQRKVRSKSNEIPVVPELLRALELAGCIVTADALHCQKNIAREIVEADADYVLALKGNQGTAFAEVKAFLDDAITRRETHLATLETLGKEHGRIEERRHWQTGKLEWFADRTKWEGLKSVGLVEARRTVGGKETVRRRYYLSSLGVEVEKFARAVRGHWAVENGLHWVLDVVFGEDQSPCAHGLCGGEPGGHTTAGREPPAPRPNVPAQHQGQAPARRHRPRLPQTHPQILICVSPAMTWFMSCRSLSSFRHAAASPALRSMSVTLPR